jgi:ferredoxin
LAKLTKPTLTVIDAVWGMEGEGPANGKKKKIGILVAGDNVFETDYNISKLINIPYDTIPYLKIALEEGLFKKNKEEFPKYSVSFEKPHSSFIHRLWNVLPASLKNLVSNYWIKKPVINENCIRCGDCMRACPVKAIKIDKKAVINYKKCIRCYCCHELCRYESIDLKKRII